MWSTKERFSSPRTCPHHPSSCSEARADGQAVWGWQVCWHVPKGHRAKLGVSHTGKQQKVNRRHNCPACFSLPVELQWLSRCTSSSVGWMSLLLSFLTLTCWSQIGGKYRWKCFVLKLLLFPLILHLIIDDVKKKSTTKLYICDLSELFVTSLSANKHEVCIHQSLLVACTPLRAWFRVCWSQRESSHWFQCVVSQALLQTEMAGVVFELVWSVPHLVWWDPDLSWGSQELLQQWSHHKQIQMKSFCTRQLFFFFFMVLKTQKISLRGMQTVCTPLCFYSGSLGSGTRRMEYGEDAQIACIW